MTIMSNAFHAISVQVYIVCYFDKDPARIESHAVVGCNTLLLLVINTVCISANNLTPAEQLKLSLIWNRVDIAQEKIFSQTTHWNVSD